MIKGTNKNIKKRDKKKTRKFTQFGHWYTSKNEGRDSQNKLLVRRC